MKTTRLFSLLIAFVMIFSSLPLIAIADGESEFVDPYDYVNHYPDRDEPYVELYDEYVEGSTYQWYKGETAIEGETEPELKCELEFATEYTCIITLPDAKKIRPAFDTNPTILQQPNEYSPAFVVSDSDRVESYQWYADIITDTAITDDNASNKCSTCENEKYSSYDKDENLWTGAFVSKIEGIYEFFCFSVELKAGDMLLVDVGPEVQEIRITDSDYDIVDSPSYSLVGDIGVYTVEVDETYTVSIFTTSEDSKVSAYIRNAETDVLLEDETESKLEGGMFGGYYYCVATYDNDDTLKSNIVAFIPEVYEQPNAVTYDFYVSNSHLAKFQWYQVILNEDDSEEIIVLEGENDYILQNYERDGVYYCEAAYPLCMVLRSKRVTALPVIIEQPSAMSPEFLVTFEDEAEFSWYETEIETTFIDDEMAEPAGSDEVATYDEATGVWTGAAWIAYEEDGYVEYGIDVLYVELEAGTTIRMAVSDKSKLVYPEIAVMGDSVSGDYAEFTDDGYAYFTVDEDDLYNIYFYVTEPTVTITVELVEYSYTLIEGETEKKLSVCEKNKFYTAMASYDDGETVLISDTFKMVAKIIKQPTSEDPSVDVNVKEDDMKYQWYEAIPETSYVTDEDVELTDEDNPAVYNSETKEWTPTIYEEHENEDGSITYELDLFIMSLQVGDVVNFVPGEELEFGEITIIQQYYGDDIIITPNHDGSYTFTALEAQEYYFYTYDDNAEVTFKVTKTTYSLGDAVEGQDKAELIDALPGTYICVVTYNDGTELISDVVNISIAGDIDADGDVDATDYILVKRAVLKSITLTEEQAKFADIDADGDVDATDYVLVKRIVLGTYKA